MAYNKIKPGCPLNNKEYTAFTTFINTFLPGLVFSTLLFHLDINTTRAVDITMRPNKLPNEMRMTMTVVRSLSLPGSSII